MSVEFGQRVLDAADLVGPQHAPRQQPVALAVDRQRDGLGRGLLDRDVVDAADLIGRGADELGGDVLAGFAVAAGGDEELGVVQRDRRALFERQVPEFVLVVAAGQRRLRSDRVGQRVDVDVGILDPRGGVQVVLQIRRLVQVERLRRRAPHAGRRDDGHGELQLGGEFERVGGHGPSASEDSRHGHRRTHAGRFTHIA